MTPFTRARALGVVLLCAVAVAAGCADQGAPTREDRSAPTAGASAKRRPVDAGLVAFLSKARAAHHSGDLAESAGQLELAIRHVEVVVAEPLPAPGPEVDEVLADAYARLADLKSRTGKFDDASRDVDRGLERARQTTHFRGHLFEVRGLVEERRMKALEAAGDGAGAERARKAALAAFEEAIRIQDEVIKELLPDPAPSPSAAP